MIVEELEDDDAIRQSKQPDGERARRESDDS
jgi:hypothetical protein